MPLTSGHPLPFLSFVFIYLGVGGLVLYFLVFRAYSCIFSQASVTPYSARGLILGWSHVRQVPYLILLLFQLPFLIAILGGCRMKVRLYISRKPNIILKREKEMLTTKEFLVTLCLCATSALRTIQSTFELSCVSKGS